MLARCDTPFRRPLSRNAVIALECAPARVRMWRKFGATPMPYVMIDIESDGPIPGDYSMICFGAVIVEPELNRTFYGKLKTISEKFIPDALAVSGFTREECLQFDDPQAVMEQFRQWLATNCQGRMMFVSDN